MTVNSGIKFVPLFLRCSGEDGLSLANKIDVREIVVGKIRNQKTDKIEETREKQTHR